MATDYVEVDGMRLHPDEAQWLEAARDGGLDPEDVETLLRRLDRTRRMEAAQTRKVGDLLMDGKSREEFEEETRRLRQERDDALEQSKSAYARGLRVGREQSGWAA